MVAVIFEVTPKESESHVYFDLAAKLKPVLETIEGFVSVERFQSLTDPAKFLSLSFFKDEASVAQWRNMEMHRHAQSAGRKHVFTDYRIRIAHVVRDYGMFDRNEAPVDSRKANS
jgi:heme-degrading monooxygenase HmoA